MLSRVNAGEDQMGFLQMRVKKHRWYSNILKSNDPLIFSVGWRRFQSMPVFAVQDQNDRFRMIKYTPLHDFCTAFFYSPFFAPNTGVACFQTLASDAAKFRIAATGTVLSLTPTAPNLFKKLKLTGAF